MSINVNFENQKFFYDLIMENKIENIDEDNNTVQINGEIRRSNIQTGKKRDGTVVQRYCVISYCGFKIKLHRLVYMYHTRELIPEGLYINHIDGNKQNNRYNNLELVTPAENTKHACKTGLLILPGLAGELAGTAKLTNEQVAQFRREFKAKEKTVKEIAIEAGLSNTAAYDMLVGRTWKIIDKIESPTPLLGRVKGEDVWSAKLTNEQVIDYRCRFKAGEITVKQICEETGIFHTSIYNMLRGKTWATVDNGESICVKEVRKVKMTDKKTGDEKIFNSIDDCCAYIKSIYPDRTDKIIRRYVRGTITGNRRSAFNSIFEYVD